MNVSYRWLLSIASTIEGTPQELADRLGMLGAPVDEMTDLSADLGDVVIARVDAVRQHPNADRLRICTVDAGGAPLQVVCGAPNVEAGRMYPFAPVGSRLPGGVEIGKAKLRGEISEGMLCSPREIGMGKDHSGLMTLNGEWPTGSSFVEKLELIDTRLELDITPNRSDLLSHLGVARELAPGGVADLQLPSFPGAPSVALEPVAGEAEAASDAFKVTIEDPSGCPRYMALAIQGVTIGPSPEWLATRLRAIGLRPINNVVDATNYVLHEVGQPLHAFDLDRLRGAEIRVRPARPGEVLRTLDGIDRTLSASALVIADRDGPVALAGVMGGQESEVGPATTAILLECANFDARRVRATAKAFGMSTDASHRFERGVDPEGQPRALQRVAELILAISGGEVRGPAVDVHPKPSARAMVDLRPARVKTVLGMGLPLTEITGLLDAIGFHGEGSDGTMRVEVPPYRPDVTREIDLIEEIARRRGYDSFTSDLSYARPSEVPPDSLTRFQPRVHQLFARWGFLESRTAAFAPAAEGRVPLTNPLSSEESHLRDDLTSGLIRRVEHNWRHGVRAVRLYEMGSVFRPGPGVAAEEVHLAAAFTGPCNPPHWSAEASPYDVWDLKGLVDDVAELLGLESSMATEGDHLPSLDWEESFLLRGEDGEVVGRAGRVAASAVDAPAWGQPLWALEVRLQPRPGDTARLYRDLPEYPAVERDVALLLGRGVTGIQVETVIRSRAGGLLEDLRAFDLYVGKGLPEGTRSVAWRLRFRHKERTLIDSEVDDLMASVVRALKEELNVERR